VADFSIFSRLAPPVNAMPTPERWSQRCFLLQADGETRSPFEIAVCLDLPSLDGKADPKIVPPCIDTAAMESLKALDSDRPIREADIKNLAPSVRYRSGCGHHGIWKISCCTAKLV
jgi:hypothetical protein